MFLFFWVLLISCFFVLDGFGFIVNTITVVANVGFYWLFIFLCWKCYCNFQFKDTLLSLYCHYIFDKVLDTVFANITKDLWEKIFQFIMVRMDKSWFMLSSWILLHQNNFFIDHGILMQLKRNKIQEKINNKKILNQIVTPCNQYKKKNLMFWTKLRL